MSQDNYHAVPVYNLRMAWRGAELGKYEKP